MKFKIGDKVKILPSADWDGIDPADFGREAIVECNHNYSSMVIRMVKPKGHSIWYIHGKNIIPVIETGQLLFDFYKVKL